MRSTTKTFPSGIKLFTARQRPSSSAAHPCPLFQIDAVS